MHWDYGFQIPQFKFKCRTEEQEQHVWMDLKSEVRLNTRAHWHAFPMTPTREILDEFLEETATATMAAIRGTTIQIHFAPKPFFFLNSLFTITFTCGEKQKLTDFQRKLLRERNAFWSESTQWIVRVKVFPRLCVDSGGDSPEKKSVLDRV